MSGRASSSSAAISWACGSRTFSQNSFFFLGACASARLGPRSTETRRRATTLRVIEVFTLCSRLGAMAMPMCLPRKTPPDDLGDHLDLRRQFEQLVGEERLRAVAQGPFGLVVDLDEQAIAARRHRRAGDRGDLVPDARRVARIHDDRQVAER